MENKRVRWFMKFYQVEKKYKDKLPEPLSNYVQLVDEELFFNPHKRLNVVVKLELIQNHFLIFQ